MLTTDQRSFYDREGWLLLPQLLSTSIIDELTAATERLQARAAHVEVDTNIDGVYFEVQSATGKKRQRAVYPGALRKITNPSRDEDCFLRLRRDPTILSLCRACGLKDPHVVVDQLTMKPARLGTGFPFHQDAAFLHGDARIEVARFGGLHLVVALDDADETNGGFEVLSRTHSDGVLLPHGNYDASSRSAAVFDETHHQLVPMRRGDAVAFHPLLAHGSGPNRSEGARRMVTVWCVGGSRFG